MTTTNPPAQVEIVVSDTPSGTVRRDGNTVHVSRHDSPQARARLLMACGLTPRDGVWTDLVPTPLLDAQMTEARAKATDPAQRAMLDRVDAELVWWKRSDVDKATILRLAPTPTLPCPTWCTEGEGHPFDDYDAGELGRWHERTMSDLDYLLVTLRRRDRLIVDTGVERIEGASRVDVEVYGDGGGSPSLTPAQAVETAALLTEAARLMTEAQEAGDTVTMGTGDLSWQEQRDAQEG
ncbi:DUF6907 domain-containing protein [Jannaschia sp. R86511]|uniref:DUF6907 domain-containing protein n=1 Tax=Jannaschia sp. R86511 TaxID=3093853 RepID=UPI0036D3EC05